MEQPKPIEEKPEKTEKIEKPKRNKAEVAALKSELSFVAKNISGKPDLRLVPGAGWAASLGSKLAEERKKYPHKKLEDFDPNLFMPEILIYPEDHLTTKDDDFIYGVLRHEIGHFRNSDYLALTEFTEQAVKEGYAAQDLIMLYNSWEDGRSNKIEGAKSERAKYLLGYYLREDIKENLAPDLKNSPAPVQFGMVSWGRGLELFVSDFDFVEAKKLLTNAKAQEAYEKLEPVLDEFLNETEDGRHAFRDIMFRKAWPVYKELIKNYLEEQAKKTAKNLADQKKDWDKLGEEEKQKTIEDANKEKIDEEAKEAWDKLPEELKDKIKQAVRAYLSKKEEEAAKNLMPSSMDIKVDPNGRVMIAPKEVPNDIKEKVRLEIAAERGKRAKEEAERAEAKKKELEQMEADRKKLLEKQAGMKYEDLEKYNQYYSPVKKYVDQLVGKLDEIFPPKIESEWEGGHKRGKRIDVRGIGREIPAKTGKIFEQKNVLEEKNLAFTLLIDVSGSMGGTKIQEALKAAILMAEGLSKKNIPFEILAFGSDFYELKKFDEPYFGKQKFKLMSILNLGGGTDIGFATDQAAKRLQRRFLSEKANGALIVFTDGEPAPNPEHRGPEWELKSLVEKWSKKMPLLGVGIGHGMEATIKHYFDKSGLYVPDVNLLPAKLLDILKKQLRRFEKVGE